LDFDNQEMCGESYKPFSLEVAEDIEQWVNPESLKWEYTWEELEEIWERDDPYNRLFSTFLPHFMRVGHDPGVGLREAGEVYYYQQPTARMVLNRRVRNYLILFLVFLLFLLAYAVGEGFSLSVVADKVWGVLVSVVYWSVDVLAPMVFLFLVGWRGVGLLVGREEKKLLGENKKDE